MRTKRNILVTFTTDYYPSNTGFAQAFSHLHKCLLVNGKCDYICVFAEGVHKSPDPEKIEVHSFDTMKGLGFLRYKYLEPFVQVKLINKYKYIFQRIDELENSDNIQMILIESMFVAWIIPVLKKRFPQIPIVCRIHGTGPEYTAYYKQMNETPFREYLLECVFKLDNVAATTKYYFDFFRDYYQDYGRFIDKDFFILPNTTEVPSGQSLDKDSSKFYLFQLGRMDMRGYHQKGFQDTVKALLYLESKNPDLAKKIIFKTVGCGEREYDFLKRTKAFKYISHQHNSKLNNEEVKKLEVEADLILVPSRCEGMSMFALEAIAAGKPLICTTGNGLESVGKNNFNAQFISEYDYVRMANAIEHILSDSGVLLEYSQNSIKYFDNNCSYKAVADKYDVIAKYLNRL